MTTTFLVAPNAFKNCLSAQEVTSALIQGIMSSGKDCSCIPFPIADGGDGSGVLLSHHLKANEVTCKVNDPLGRLIDATYGYVPESKMAIIEMAEAAGLRLLRSHELNPLRANTFGVGELIRHAVAQGSRTILLGAGGSATVDGGIGLLAALGVRFCDASGAVVEPLPEFMERIQRIDCASCLSLKDIAITVMTDVDNTLIGPLGAAPVFGPQKGATKEMVELLSKGLGHLECILTAYSGRVAGMLPGGGAGGGIGAALHAVFGARVVRGSALFLEVSGFQQALDECDVVITGEGSLDQQTLFGKGPFTVAEWAGRANKKTLAVAGVIQDREQFGSVFERCISLSDLAGRNDDPILNAKTLLTEAGRRLAQEFNP